MNVNFPVLLSAISDYSYFVKRFLQKPLQVTLFFFFFKMKPRRNRIGGTNEHNAHSNRRFLLHTHMNIFIVLAKEGKQASKQALHEC